MLRRLRSLLGDDATRVDAVAERESAPKRVAIAGAEPLDLAAHVDAISGFPVVRWDAVESWMESMPEAARAGAWAACERAWMLHMRDALGAAFRLDEGSGAIVVSSLEPRQARQALDFMERTLKRIVRVLDGVAAVPAIGKDLLILFDDPDAYYAYVSIYHPDRGEFALSSGMQIGGGCSHFVTMKGDLASLEPVIVHEMTHACLNHLALPLWLNEGLAVNTEHRVAGKGQPLHTPQEMRARHLKFWGPAEVQQFWSGRSFRRHDDGNELSYDLARILTEQLAVDWARFAAFARTAHYDDGGEAAAREHLGMTLGEAVAALLEAPEASRFAPDAASWHDPAEHVPERGMRLW